MTAFKDVDETILFRRSHKMRTRNGCDHGYVDVVEIQEVDQFSMLPVIAELKDTEQVQSLDEQCTGFRGLDHPYRYGKHVLL